MNENKGETEHMNENESGIEKIHVLYYRNQFSSYYRADERVIKQIVHNNVNCIHPGHKPKLTLY